MPFRTKNKIYFLIVFLLSMACDRMDYFPTKEFDFSDDTIVLTHRASGNSPHYRENTLEAAAFGFHSLDGIEVDVAISQDYGLWLTHDSKVKSIDKYFINTTDEEIRSIKEEDGSTYYNRLKEILKHMAAFHKDKYISLDIKYPFELFTSATFTNVAEKISLLVKKYHLQGKVFVESNSLGLLQEVSDQGHGIETYYMCFGNYEKGIGFAYQNNLTGISFDYGRDDELTVQSVELAHDLNVKLLVYTINQGEINTVYDLGVDVIQTDHADFYELLWD